ncbi:Pre-mRNA-splicing factor SPF27 [Brachionus plicatilis]|uniref:Pre-mRNA-splicing factor SPF27 n=1 Tax=Brachionus plicatilis TaxID=10195 RepID=A0A3M7PSE4_BRAPC|nr:Pre-mRNA-splicing factor SPF27 [Brachionus plicatilis]
MANEILVDALPYIDSGYEEPEVKQMVFSLIEEECRRYKPTKNYLEVFGPTNLHAFETDILKNEFQRMEQRQPMEMMSMKRYELLPPSSGKQSDVSAWLESVENSQAQLEHQISRIVNLELLSDYGANSWKTYNQTLKSMTDQAEKQLEDLKKNIQNVNLSRKYEQTSAGSKLDNLEKKWIGLVSKNYEIECAIVELEKELIDIKKKKISAEENQNDEKTVDQNQKDD